MTQQQKAKDKRLKKTYGLSLLEYNKILKLQNFRCAICKRLPTGRSLSVDHSHVKQDKKHRGKECRARVRGLLCWTCNSAIAKFRDSSEKLRVAAEYLENPPAQKVLK